MAKPVTMPQLGESVTEGTITRWLKAEGDEVEIDEPLAEVDTDKVNAELPSPVAGKIEKFLVSEGTTVDVGTEIRSSPLTARSPGRGRPATGERAADAPTEEFPAADTEAQPAVENGGEKQRAVAEARDLAKRGQRARGGRRRRDAAAHALLAGGPAARRGTRRGDSGDPRHRHGRTG